MSLVVLPIHIWDRELDSRILLAALLANDGNIVVMGHEYNIAPLYTKTENIFHYGAGRPIYNKLRTDEWYQSIIERNGFNGLVCEEGLNDIDKTYQLLYCGIDKKSIKTTSKVYSWTTKDRDLMMSQYNGNLKEELIEKTCIAGNARIELNGTLGHNYYKEKTASINNLFGDYVLISDNFGGIERWGSNMSYKADKDLDERCDKVEAAKMKKEIENRIILTKAARINFCKVINSLVEMNPSIPFLFRPHPVVNPKFWYDNLVQTRNLHIIYKDSKKCRSKIRS